MTVTFRAGTVMLSGPADPEGVAEAKLYCHRLQLTQKDAAIRFVEDQVAVILKRDVQYENGKIIVQQTEEER